MSTESEPGSKSGWRDADIEQVGKGAMNYDPV